MSDNRVFKKYQSVPKDQWIMPEGQPLAASTFSKQGTVMKSKRYFTLHENGIFYYNDEKDKQPKGFTELDFGLRFLIIREKEKKPENSPGIGKIGKAKGIRFERDGCQCELFSTDVDAIIKWRGILRGRINQRGFHELFRALKKIGKGNFASVYLAERLEDEQYFAVKAFSKEAAFSQEKGKEALMTEIELMRALDHRSIMKLHEVFETENSLYFILDLLEGGQLYDLIKAKHRFTPAETKSIMYGLVSGLAHMHQRRVMHRDLKPENIIFRKKNDTMDCVIADLGLGTKVDLEEYLFVRCGTPGFVAPEVVNIKDMKTTYDSVCDMYSLGLIFHILLIGKPPFNGKSYNEVLSQNRNGIVNLSGPEWLRVANEPFDLIKKMVQKDPKKRITSAQAVKHPYFKEYTNPGGQQQKGDIDEVAEESKEDISTTMSQQKDSQDTDPNTAFLRKESAQMAKVKQQVTNSPVMPSPALLPRKLPQQLEADSCVKFKMGQSPILTGLTEDVGKGGGTSPGSVFVMNQLDTPNSKLRQLGKSPQVGKSPMSQLGRQGGGNANKIKNALMMETGVEKIDENEEIKQEKETQKKASKVNNNLKGMI